MSKNIKRQRKLEEVFSNNSSTKKKKSDVDEKKDDVPTSSKTTTAVIEKISNDDLEVLKQFDLNLTFGPCTGIPRIDRYERALRHGLDPPIRVLELINLYPNVREVTYCIWRDYAL